MATAAVSQLTTLHHQFFAVQQAPNQQRLIVMGAKGKSSLLNGLMGNLCLYSSTCPQFLRVNTKRGIALCCESGGSAQSPFVMEFSTGKLRGTYAIEMPKVEVLDAAEGILRDVFMHIVTKYPCVKICALVTEKEKCKGLVSLVKRLVSIYPYTSAMAEHPMAKSILVIGVGSGRLLRMFREYKDRQDTDILQDEKVAYRFLKEIFHNNTACRFNAPFKRKLQTDCDKITDRILKMDSCSCYTLQSNVVLRLSSGRIVVNIMRAHLAICAVHFCIENYTTSECVTIENAVMPYMVERFKTYVSKHKVSPLVLFIEQSILCGKVENYIAPCFLHEMRRHEVVTAIIANLTLYQKRIAIGTFLAGCFLGFPYVSSGSAALGLASSVLSGSTFPSFLQDCARYGGFAPCETSLNPYKHLVTWWLNDPNKLRTLCIREFGHI